MELAHPVGYSSTYADEYTNEFRLHVRGTTATNEDFSPTKYESQYEGQI